MILYNHDNAFMQRPFLKGSNALYIESQGIRPDISL